MKSSAAQKSLPRKDLSSGLFGGLGKVGVQVGVHSKCMQIEVNERLRIISSNSVLYVFSMLNPSINC